MEPSVLEIDLPATVERFRDELRGWLEANRPEGLPEEDGRRRRMEPPELKAWGETLRAAGYMCVAWPEEYGGRGLSGLEVAVMNEEFARAGVPRVTRGMGESLVGPAIIQHGTDEQKAHFLPRIISGEDRYCQGFSEPDAGSDLAALKTRGEVVDGEVVITGQKVWTSFYWDATMQFCLCRTDPDAPKHQGISYVLIPIRHEDGSSNGIEFRPIKQITGESHFAETFLTEARAPLFNVIGGPNNGWKVAMTTLGYERGGNATTQHLQFAKEFWRLVEEVRRRGRAGDPLVRRQLAWAYTHVELIRIRGMRILAAMVNGGDVGALGAASLNKVLWSEYVQRLSAIAMNMIGPAAIASDGDHMGRWSRAFLGNRSHTIWGGTAEIQRNILGERILGLPKEPDPSREPGRTTGGGGG